MASSSLEPPPELLEAQPEQELVSISPEIIAVAAPLPSRDELYAMGKTLRSKFPRKAHAEWKPAADRRCLRRASYDPQRNRLYRQE